MELGDFNWKIDEQKTWPPYGRIKPPFGVTIVEIVRSCPLRTCFDASKTQGYEPLMGFAARVGTAFHRSFEFLMRGPFPKGIAAAQAASEARQFFEHQIAEQEAERQLRPREKGRPVDHIRIARAQQAIIREARRLAETGGLGSGYLASAKHNSLTNEFVVDDLSDVVTSVEVPVSSKDGLFAGRIDRVERFAGGLRIIDFKSAIQDDLPDRYKRQLQLYAWMWHELRNEWPSEAFVVYPFTLNAHQVEIEPNFCEQVADESREAMKLITEPHSPFELATPGTVCQVCEYRPWCQAFWRFQAAENNYRQALEQAHYGLEGTVVRIELENHYWLVDIKWRNTIVRMAAPEERFSQLKNVAQGMNIRLLDAQLTGQMHRPTAVISEYTELFVLEN